MAKARKPSQKTTLKPAKARKILEEGQVGGKPITKKQQGFFGAVAGKSNKK